MGIININNLKFGYKKNRLVIDDISLEINKGSWTSIIGHNGSGKSTLSKLINGLLMPDSGNIEVNGMVLSEENVNTIRKNIGIVFQNPDNQFVGSTVRDDVAFGLENRLVNYETMVEVVEAKTKDVNMIEYIDEEPQNLSGGQKQRVALAGVLTLDTDIIIFDEAMSMLDPKGREEVTEFLIKLANDPNKTIITITHNLELAAKSDYIYVFNKGKIFDSGLPKDVFSNLEELENIGLSLPFKLRILHDKNDIDKKVRDYLWESTFKR